MTDIPPDIRAAAIAVVDRGYNVGLIDAVAEALMAERERCAKIAESMYSYPKVSLTWGDDGSPIETPAGLGGSGPDIAARIREAPHKP